MRLTLWEAEDALPVPIDDQERDQSRQEDDDRNTSTTNLAFADLHGQPDPLPGLAARLEHPLEVKISLCLEAISHTVRGCPGRSSIYLPPNGGSRFTWIRISLLRTAFPASAGASAVAAGVAAVARFGRASAHWALAPAPSPGERAYAAPRAARRRRGGRAVGSWAGDPAGAHAANRRTAP